MLIGRVAELTGATRKAIRHYETIGLIDAPARKGNYRVYSEHDVLVIGMIRRAQTLGASLAELSDIVAKKSADRKLPIDLACSLIDKKIADVKQQIEALALQEDKLQKFKADLILDFS